MLKINDCSRCGGDHYVDDAETFTNPDTNPKFGGMEATHWTTCPETDDPIFLVITVMPDKES